MNRKKCQICKRDIPIFFFNNHFSQCKQYYIVNTNRKTNIQEKVFVKLFNFLDDELGLNKREIFSTQKREFLNNQQYICIKEMEENARIEHMNNIYLNNLKKERDSKIKENQLKKQMEREKERKRQEYLTKINQERILKERKMRKIREEERLKKMKIAKLNEERELRLKALREQELEQQRLYKKQQDEIKIRENLEKEREERIRIRLEKERERNLRIDMERKQLENEKENVNVNEKVMDKMNDLSKKIEFKMGKKTEFVKKGVIMGENEPKQELNNKSESEPTKPNNDLNPEIANNLKNYSLMNLRSGGLTFNNNSFLNKVLTKYTQLFREYIRGKSVVIVGPANSIIGTGKGDLIDKFDIVIRLNKALPVPQNLKKDIGSRTDIVYNALNTTDFPGQNNLDTTFYKRNGVKFVVSPYPLSGVFYNDIINYISKYQFDIPFRTVIPSKFFGFKNQLKTRPYTGTCAIMDILQFEAKALYITGIDFYNTPYYSQYRRIKRTKLNSLRENSIHSAFPQMEYLLYKSLMDKRVILDKTLEKLLMNQYIKFSNNIGSINGLSIIQTQNVEFMNIINELLNTGEVPKVLLIGKDVLSNGFDNNYDLYFDFTQNKYRLEFDRLISCGYVDNRMLGNILFKKNNNKTIVLTHNVKRIMKFLLKVLDIKHCSQKLFHIIYLIMIFKKIDITGFNFNRELSKKQKYKELLLIKFLEKFNFIKIIP